MSIFDNLREVFKGKDSLESKSFRKIRSLAAAPSSLQEFIHEEDYHVLHYISAKNFTAQSFTVALKSSVENSVHFDGNYNYYLRFPGCDFIAVNDLYRGLQEIFSETEELFSLNFDELITLNIPLLLRRFLPERTLLKSWSHDQAAALPVAKQQHKNELMALVRLAHATEKPLELRYRSKRNIYDKYVAQQLHAHRVQVKDYDENGFRGEHERGVRRYSWSALESVVITTESTPLRSLALELSFLLEHGKPFLRATLDWEDNFTIGARAK